MGAALHIKAAMLYKGESQIGLAQKMGRLPQTFYNMLSRDAMRFSEVEQIADALECDVVLIDRRTGQVF